MRSAESPETSDASHPRRREMAMTERALQRSATGPPRGLAGAPSCSSHLRLASQVQPASRDTAGMPCTSHSCSLAEPDAGEPAGLWRADLESAMKRVALRSARKKP